MQRPGDKLINEMGGLQNFINWENPYLLTLVVSSMVIVKAKKDK